MGRLMQDGGTAEPASRGTKFSGVDGDRANGLVASRIGNLTRLIHTICYYDRTLVLSTCPLHTNSGCGKERRISIGPW